MIKILIPIYIPWPPNLGGVIDAKESGRNNLMSSPMLCFLNMGVNCSYLQRNIFSQASIQFNKNMYYTLKMPKQEIVELQTRRTLLWDGKNDAIINFRRCYYSLNSFK